MKNILSYKKFTMLKEAAPLTDMQNFGATKMEQQDKDFETPKTNSAVLLKKLMPELRSHLIYWFKFGKLSDMLDADTDDITIEDRGLCMWATDTNGSDENKYQWRIKIVEAQQEGMVERIDKVKLILDIFDYNKEYNIRTAQTIVKVEKLSEDFLISKIKHMKSTILKVPKNSVDVKKFKDDEQRMLGDDIY